MLFSSVLAKLKPRPSPRSTRSRRSLIALQACPPWRLPALDLSAFSLFPNRHRDENPVTLSPLDSAFTNAVTRKSFVMCIYENTGVSPFQLKLCLLKFAIPCILRPLFSSSSKFLFCNPFPFKLLQMPRECTLLPSLSQNGIAHRSRSYLCLWSLRPYLPTLAFISSIPVHYQERLAT